MSAPANSLVEDLTPREKRDIRNLAGEFCRNGPNDVNYKMSVTNNGTYLFNLDSTPLGVKLCYKGCVKRKGLEKQLNRDAPILGSVVSEIQSKKMLDVGSLEGVRIEQSVHNTDF